MSREGGEQELMFFNLEMRSELKYTKLIKIPISKKERVREKKCQRKEKTIRNSLCLFDAVFDHAAFVTTQARHAPSANNTNAVACANISRGGRESTTTAAEAAAERETSKSCRANNNKNNNNSDRGNNFISAHADVPDRDRDRDRDGDRILCLCVGLINSIKRTFMRLFGVVVVIFVVVGRSRLSLSPSFLATG